MDEQFAESRERSRRAAGRLLTEAFGAAEPDLAVLLDVAVADLGGVRLVRCVASVAAGPLSGRRDRLAALAELAVATRTLGLVWWERPLLRWAPQLDGPEVMDGSPDEFLESGAPAGEWVDRRSGVLGWLAVRASDAVAVVEMGPPAAWADLNTMSPYSFPLDVAARPGDRVSVAYDAGARCQGVVEAAPDGRLRARLDLDSSRHVLCSEVRWAWGVSASLTGWRLPGETPDPYTALVDPTTAEILLRWAAEQAADVPGFGVAWRTAGDVLAGVDPLRWESRVPGGWWLTWEIAALAVADGDLDTARKQVADLLRVAPLHDGGASPEPPPGSARGDVS